MSSHQSNKLRVVRDELLQYTPYGHCMRTSRLRQCMEGPYNFTAVAGGGGLESVDARNGSILMGFTQPVRNFIPENGTDLGSNIDDLLLARFSDYVQASTSKHDQLGTDGSGWGYCSLLQARALEKKDIMTKYTTSQVEGYSASCDQAQTDPDAPYSSDEDSEGASGWAIPDNIFNKPRPLNMSHFDSIKQQFCQTSHPLTIGCLSIISFMDGGADVTSPNNMFLSNHGSPKHDSRLAKLNNDMSTRPDWPAKESIASWIMTAERFGDEDGGTRCLLVEPSVFNKILADPECQKLAFERGTYTGTFDEEDVTSVPFRL